MSPLKWRTSCQSVLVVLLLLLNTWMIASWLFSGDGPPPEIEDAPLPPEIEDVLPIR